MKLAAVLRQKQNRSLECLLPIVHADAGRMFNRPNTNQSIQRFRMKLFQIKICGVKTVADARFALEQGADAIGLNFFPKSSRFLDPQAAKLLLDELRHNESVDSMEVNPASHAVVFGVFVNWSAAQLIETAITVGLDGIQLHGDETPEIVGRIRDGLQANGKRCAIIRAIRTKPAGDGVGEDDSAAEANAELNRIQNEIIRWGEAGVDGVLLDAAVPGEFGGTGKQLDWRSVPQLASKVPIILAGGLTPDNVEQAILISGVQSVDVASGVESAPGQKDPALVAGFIEASTKVLVKSGDE